MRSLGGVENRGDNQRHDGGTYALEDGRQVLVAGDGLRSQKIAMARMMRKDGRIVPAAQA